jgi:hypothetical protein
MSLNTLERDDLLRQIAWLKARTDKIERMLKGEQVGTARIADAAITNAKIKDLTWDKARGGSAILGGADNVDGILSVRDALDVEKVVIDKDGILINDGKIIIKNGDNESIIDSVGIISNNVFPVNSMTENNIVYITTSDNTTIGTSISIELTRSINTLVTLSTINGTDQINNLLDLSGRTIMEVYSDVDNVIAGLYYDSFLTVATGVRENIIAKTYNYSKIVTLSAGTHNIVLRARMDSGVNARTGISSSNLSIILLGS